MPINSASIPALVTAGKIRRRRRRGGALFKMHRANAAAPRPMPEPLQRAAPKPKPVDKLAEIDKLLELERAAGGRVRLGPIVGDTGGRSDEVPMKVPNGSYVLRADFVSGLGEGNTDAGMSKLSEMFPESKPSKMRADKDAVPVLISHGEFIVSPESILSRWDDLDAGHKALDAWQTGERERLIETLRGLPPPAQD